MRSEESVNQTIKKRKSRATAEVLHRLSMRATGEIPTEIWECPVNISLDYGLMEPMDPVDFVSNFNCEVGFYRLIGQRGI